MTNLKINEEYCSLKNLIIPEGYRIIKCWEALRDSETNEELKKIMLDAYIFAITPKGLRLVGLCNDGSCDYYLDAGNRCIGNRRARGVFIEVSDVKEVE